MSMDMYNKIKVIGKGSYGEVWLVKHKKDRKQYVLKKMELQNASKRERKAAEQEAKLLSKLRHPNIVSYKDSFETEEGFLYIAMGYCEGGDLYSKLKEQKGTPLDERQVVEWFVQIAMALQYMHERHILHRDLKTQNIFLTKSKIIKVGDLGIARVLDNSSDMATTLIGTPYYMSPELFSNKPYNHKSDVWALGCCVYEMSTLKHAFNAKDMNSLVYKILRGKMPNMPRSYSPELVTLIKAMLNQNPDKRPSVNRILRDPYIKRNIAVFLEGTKNRIRPSSSRRSSRDQRTPSVVSQDVTDNDDAKSNVTSASQISHISNISAYNHVNIEVTPEDEKLPPLEVGNVLEPIIEVASPSSTAEFSQKQVVSPVKKNERVSGRGDGVGHVAPSVSHVAQPHSSNVAPPRSHVENEGVSVRKENVVQGGGDGSVQQASKDHRVSQDRDDHYYRPSRRQSRDDDTESVASVDSASSRGNRGERVKNRMAAAIPRPLPPRPGSADALPTPAQRQMRKVRGEGESDSTSGSLGSSAERPADEEADNRKMQVNESARARRRRQKEKEEDTPKAIAASYGELDLDNIERRRAEASECRVLLRPRGRGHTKTKSDPFPRAGQTEPIPAVKKNFEAERRPVPRKTRQPSITEESSSSAEEVDETDTPSVGNEVVYEREKKRKDKEMKNFISLLDTTLRMNKDEDKSDEDNSPKEAEAEPVRQVNQRPIHRVNSSPSEPVSVEKTMGATGRLMERITALRKDCIRGLGVAKLKAAYDVLDNIEGDELEPRLVEILGKDNFDMYAGKIWQLKFCEESAFGLN